MKVTVVPAQVTTVEDRIAGNLGMSQLALLVVPIFLGSAFYAVMPPSFHNAGYKLATILFIAVLCSLLAIRIKGKILLFWVMILVRYCLRPRFYVFDKRSLSGRQLYTSPRDDIATTEEVTEQKAYRPSRELTTAELVKVEDLLENPAANVHFANKKGNLYVRITEVKSEI